MLHDNFSDLISHNTHAFAAFQLALQISKRCWSLFPNIVRNPHAPVLGAVPATTFAQGRPRTVVPQLLRPGQQQCELQQTWLHDFHLYYCLYYQYDYYDYYDYDYDYYNYYNYYYYYYYSTDTTSTTRCFSACPASRSHMHLRRGSFDLRPLRLTARILHETRTSITNISISIIVIVRRPARHANAFPAIIRTILSFLAGIAPQPSRVRLI